MITAHNRVRDKTPTTPSLNFALRGLPPFFHSFLEVFAELHHLVGFAHGGHRQGVASSFLYLDLQFLSQPEQLVGVFLKLSFFRGSGWSGRCLIRPIGLHLIGRSLNALGLKGRMLLCCRLVGRSRRRRLIGRSVIALGLKGLSVICQRRRVVLIRRRSLSCVAPGRGRRRRSLSCVAPGRGRLRRGAAHRRDQPNTQDGANHPPVE
jgi:hypothetical protein